MVTGRIVSRERGVAGRWSGCQGGRSGTLCCVQSFIPFRFFIPIASLTLGSLLSAVTAIHAQQPSRPATAFDPAAVLSQLKDLRAKQEQAMKGTKSQVLASINAAAADNNSAGKAYEQAVLAVELQGQGFGADGSKIVEWRKKQGEMLRNPNFLTATRLQLYYLSLTWQRSAGAKAIDLLPALYDYTAQVENNRDAIEPYARVLKSSLNESVFTAFYQVGPYIAGVPEWEMRQFDVEGIYEKTILPELRRRKDPRLLDYWDRRLQTEAGRGEHTQNALSANKFARITKPGLLWQRAEDELLLGDKPRAVNDMLALIKMYSDHPDFGKWTARLEEIVSEPTAAP